VKNPSKPFRSSVEAVVSRGSMLGRMVKNEKWRYVEWDKGLKGIELYDQVNDPIEYNNLANLPEYAATIKKMKKIMYKGK
jgi:iduronate 2-sulfatase